MVCERIHVNEGVVDTMTPSLSSFLQQICILILVTQNCVWFVTARITMNCREERQIVTFIQLTGTFLLSPVANPVALAA
jgi:hypothetical protein